jgi:hypothetical protein
MAVVMVPQPGVVGSLKWEELKYPIGPILPLV